MSDFYDISQEEEQELLEEEFFTAVEDFFQEEFPEEDEEETKKHVEEYLHVDELKEEQDNEDYYSEDDSEGEDFFPTEEDYYPEDDSEDYYPEENEVFEDEEENYNRYYFEKILQYNNVNLKNFILYEKKINIFKNGEKLKILPMYISNTTVKDGKLYIKRDLPESINLGNLKDINKLYTLLSILIGLIGKKEEQNIKILNNNHKLSKIKESISEIIRISNNSKKLQSEIKELTR